MNLRKWTVRSAGVIFTIVVLVFAYQVAYPWVYPFYYGRYTDYEITNFIMASGYARLFLNIAFDFEEKDYCRLLDMSVGGGAQHGFEMRESYWEQGSGQYRNMSVVSWEPSLWGTTAMFSVTYSVRAYSIRYEMRGWDPFFWFKNYPDEVSQYLASKPPYFPVDDPEIRNIAIRLTNDISDPVEKARRIYNWCADNIKYEYVPEHYTDTAWIVRNRKGICEGISLAMCSMLRAIGIPARTAHGAIALDGQSMYSPNSKHAWVEFYMNSKWVACDPTWAASPENKDHYWAGMRDDIAYPSIGRPLRTTIGVMDDISFTGMGTLSGLYADLGRVRVLGDGFAAPPKETHTRQLWIGTTVTVTLTVVAGIVLWRKRKAEQRADESSTITGNQIRIETKKFCKYCGNRLSEGSRFCDQCGKRVV